MEAYMFIGLQVLVFFIVALTVAFTILEIDRQKKAAKINLELWNRPNQYEVPMTREELENIINNSHTYTFILFSEVSLINNIAKAPLEVWKEIYEVAMNFSDGPLTNFAEKLADEIPIVRKKINGNSIG